MRHSVAPRGFTLIEMILVMAVLTIVLAIAAPRLSKFMRGRSLQEESRRLLALTRFGRSQAISQSTPMEVWIMTQSRTYGVAAIPGYSGDGDKQHEYKLPDDMHFQIGANFLDADGRGSIVFWPDGSIDKSSLHYLCVARGQDGEKIGLVQRDPISGYEILGHADMQIWEAFNASTSRLANR